MTLREWGAALRVRLTTRTNWGAFLLVLGCWSGYLLYGLKRGGSMSTALIQLLSGFLFFFAFIWISPLPWQWDGEPGLRRARGRQFAQAFFSAELLMVVLVALEELLARSLGAKPYPFRVYMANLCFQGPALFLVGLMLAQQDYLTQEWLSSRKQAEEATGHQLKGQLHPHALFNSLNGLAELIGDDPLGAEAFVEAMSSFLRRVLDASRCADWPLEEERRLAEDFLLMEGMRLGARLQVTWHWDRSLDQQFVSPLLIQPLIENAVKHGINGHEAGGQLQVIAQREGAHLWLKVGNTGGGLKVAPEKSAGIGIQNLQRRLTLAYGDRASFRLQQSADGWTWATLRLTLFATSS